MPFIIFYRLTLQTQTKTQKEKQEKITEKKTPRSFQCWSRFSSNPKVKRANSGTKRKTARHDTHTCLQIQVLLLVDFCSFFVDHLHCAFIILTTKQIDWQAKQPSNVVGTPEDLKCWGAWDTTCRHKAKEIIPSITWKREAHDHLERTRKGHLQSDKH